MRSSKIALFLSLSSFFHSCGAIAAQMGSVITDSDPGADDVLVLLNGAGDETANLEIITVTDANIRVETAFDNARRLMCFAGYGEIHVVSCSKKLPHKIWAQPFV